MITEQRLKQISRETIHPDDDDTRDRLIGELILHAEKSMNEIESLKKLYRLTADVNTELSEQYKAICTKYELLNKEYQMSRAQR